MLKGREGENFCFKEGNIIQSVVPQKRKILAFPLPVIFLCMSSRVQAYINQL